MSGLLIIKIGGVGLLTAIFNIVLDKINKEDWIAFTTLIGVMINLAIILIDSFYVVKAMF